MEGSIFLLRIPLTVFNLQAEVEMERFEGHTSVSSELLLGQGAHAPLLFCFRPPPRQVHTVAAPLNSCSAVVPSQFRLGKLPGRAEGVDRGTASHFTATEAKGQKRTLTNPMLHDRLGAMPKSEV